MPLPKLSMRHRDALTPATAVRRPTPPPASTRTTREMSCERHDVSGTLQRPGSTRTLTPRARTARSVTIQAPEPSGKSEEQLMTETAQSLNDGAKDFLRTHPEFAANPNHPQHKNKIRTCTPTMIEAMQTDTNMPNISRTHLEKTQRCLLYTSPSPRDLSTSRMPSSA